jgi:hypothetical protein
MMLNFFTLNDHSLLDPRSHAANGAPRSAAAARRDAGQPRHTPKTASNEVSSTLHARTARQ